MPDTATQEILDSIRQIVRGVRVSTRQTEKRWGISSAQLFVLDTLGQATCLSLNDLAEKTSTHQSSVSVVVTRLVKRGLIKRSVDEGDARRLALSLTPRGRDFLKAKPETLQRRLLRAIEKLKPSSKRAVAQGLSEIIREAGLNTGAAPLFFEDQTAAKSIKRGARKS